MSILKTIYLQHLNGANANMTLTSDEKVGIGTSSPSAKLHVSTGTTGGIALLQGSTRTMYFEDDGSGSRISTEGTGQFSIRAASSGGNHLTIDGSGRVTMPYQPMCWLTHNSIVSYAQNALIQWTSSYDPLSMFSGAPNYRVTVPVAGRYRITVDLLINSGSTSPMAIYVRRNGSLVRRFYTNNDGYQATSISIILNCSANDYIDTISYESGTTSIWGGDIGNFTVELIG